MTYVDDRVEAARARILALRTVQATHEREGSQIALMFEFLRRAAMWSEKIEIEWPWQSVAEALAANTPHANALLALRADVEPALLGLPSRARSLALSYMEWCALEALAPDTLVLPSPYEPAMLMLERGAEPTIENGMFQFHVASFPMRRATYYLSKPPYTELDAETLDRHDAEWRSEHPRGT